MLTRVNDLAYVVDSLCASDHTVGICASAKCLRSSRADCLLSTMRPPVRPIHRGTGGSVRVDDRASRGPLGGRRSSWNTRAEQARRENRSPVSGERKGAELGEPQASYGTLDSLLTCEGRKLFKRPSTAEDAAAQTRG